MIKKFRTGILVRNNRVKLMQDAGIKVHYSILSDKEYLDELKKKIVEEANEVADSDSLDDLKCEIADVLEVIDHIIDITHLNIDEIQQYKLDKQKKVGKFDKKIKTHYLKIDEDNESINYYLQRPKKYPLMED